MFKTRGKVSSQLLRLLYGLLPPDFIPCVAVVQRIMRLTLLFLFAALIAGAPTSTQIARISLTLASIPQGTTAAPIRVKATTRRECSHPSTSPSANMPIPPKTFKRLGTSQPGRASRPGPCSVRRHWRTGLLAFRLQRTISELFHMEYVLPSRPQYLLITLFRGPPRYCLCQEPISSDVSSPYQALHVHTLASPLTSTLHIADAKPFFIATQLETILRFFRTRPRSLRTAPKAGASKGCSPPSRVE
jgi:hypothetical protein